MRPLRRHRRFALVALLAFAAQIILSFGHMHDGASPVHASAPSDCLLHQPCSPAEPNEHHDFCAFCWAISAAGSLILPLPLQLRLNVASYLFFAHITSARPLQVTDSIGSTAIA